jgi:hypothetical protein
MVNRESISRLLMEHQSRRPLMRGADFYKLLFQGIYGVGHIMGEGAWGWLVKESEKLDLQKRVDESFTENVSADGEVIRANLRPYMRRGLPLEGLFMAMRETAQIEGSSEAFMGAWEILKERVNMGELSIASDELNTLDRELKEKGIVPHHHSEDYRRAYEPSYRVVRRSAFEKNVEKKPDQGF